MEGNKTIVRVQFMKILMVEDDRTIASGLEYSLQQEDYETILSHNAESAKRVIEEKCHEIDLFLFDLNLPDGSGYDLCALVK
jgi:two-component system, OmpR family, response regulator VicR